MLMRLLRHRMLDERDALRALGDDALARIAAHVAASEAGHAGQIRVCVEAGLPLSYIRRGATARDRAVAMFSKLRVWDTELNNGVLVYLLLAEHAIEIVADRGIDRLVSAAEWQAICALMQRDFAAGEYEKGALAGVAAIGDILSKHFPADGSRNPDELPDRPVFL